MIQDSNGIKFIIPKINLENLFATKMDFEEEAKKHLENLEKTYPNMYEIRTFEPSYKRCEEYCSCCEFCDYWRNHYEK